MSPAKRKREVLQMAREVSAKATVEVTGSNHFRITIEGPLGTRMVFCGQTPSDHRENKNLRRDLMRAAREIGLVQDNRQ